MHFPLHVMARFRVRAEYLEALLLLLAELAERSRQEPGCLEYGYYQSVDDPLAFSSFESWRTPVDEVAHWQATHVRQALVRVAPMLHAAPEIVRAARIA